MATNKKSRKTATGAKRQKPGATRSSAPVDPQSLSRALLSAPDSRSLERITKEFIKDSKHAFRPGRVNAVADAFYKLKDTIGVDEGITRIHPWNEFVSAASKFLQLRTYEYYPFNKIPNTPVYPWSKRKGYDEDPYIVEELLTSVGPSPGNPDNEISVKSGYGAFHAGSGDGVLQAVLLNGRGILGYGPSITIETDGPSSVYISTSVNVAYLFSFAANWNPQFDPARQLFTTFMSGELDLTNLYSVRDKTTGTGYASSTLDRRTIRSVGLFPEGITAPTGQSANPDVYFGLSKQFSDDLVVNYSTHLNLPANARCQFQLGLRCDVTAVGPRNGRWNKFVCNSQLQASADFPRIDVDVWPLT